MSEQYEEAWRVYFTKSGYQPLIQKDINGKRKLIIDEFCNDDGTVPEELKEIYLLCNKSGIPCELLIVIDVRDKQQKNLNALCRAWDERILSFLNFGILPGQERQSLLQNFFVQDTRKIAITTIFRFGDVEGVLNLRDNIVIMVDEAHRTQEGNFGEKMRAALPNAFFFGLTGTPINRIDKNTFRTFGATEDKSGYLSRYTFSDSIRDNATLPLNFEPVPVDLHVDKDKLDAEFDALTEKLQINQCLRVRN